MLQQIPTHTHTHLTAKVSYKTPFSILLAARVFFLQVDTIFFRTKLPNAKIKTPINNTKHKMPNYKTSVVRKSIANEARKNETPILPACRWQCDGRQPSRKSTHVEHERIGKNEKKKNTNWDGRQKKRLIDCRCITIQRQMAAMKPSKILNICLA